MTATSGDGASGRTYDAIVVGSGFGGSVAALRLSEKGHRVLVIEKGRRFRPRDFPRTNWDLPHWLWLPSVGFRGPFQMRFLRHVTVFTGVGVGGGSLVYANTLPTPPSGFFKSGAWSELADWEAELAPHYDTALRMLGATPNQVLEPGDRALGEIARELGREDRFAPTRIAVYQGAPGRTVPDPYFGGEGPERTGCIRCGRCMIGCKHGAKNTLDKNYLWLAERRGARILAETEVLGVHALPGGGYVVEARSRRRGALTFRARRVVLAGGVFGTTELLLRMKEEGDGLPELSDAVGHGVRTNSESLIGVTSRDRALDCSRGVAIGSILHTDEKSHVEPVRYPRGSGFFRLLSLPHAPGGTLASRLRDMVGRFARAPAPHVEALLVRDWARSTQILLFMQTVDGTLRFRLGRDLASGFRRSIVSDLGEGELPSTFIPQATALAERMAEKLDGVPMSLAAETLFGTPTTAHILGGACIGKDRDHGVIGSDHQVLGYEGLYVVDGAAVSGNPGVNPSLTITALAERAMSRIPPAG